MSIKRMFLFSFILSALCLAGFLNFNIQKAEALSGSLINSININGGYDSGYNPYSSFVTVNGGASVSVNFTLANYPNYFNTPISKIIPRLKCASDISGLGSDSGGTTYYPINLSNYLQSYSFSVYIPPYNDYAKYCKIWFYGLTASQNDLSSGYIYSSNSSPIKIQEPVDTSGYSCTSGKTDCDYVATNAQYLKTTYGGLSAAYDTCKQWSTCQTRTAPADTSGYNCITWSDGTKECKYVASGASWKISDYGSDPAAKSACSNSTQCKAVTVEDTSGYSCTSGKTSCDYIASNAQYQKNTWGGYTQALNACNQYSTCKPVAPVEDTSGYSCFSGESCTPVTSNAQYKTSVYTTASNAKANCELQTSCKPRTSTPIAKPGYNYSSGDCVYTTDNAQYPDPSGYSNCFNTNKKELSYCKSGFCNNVETLPKACASYNNGQTCQIGFGCLQQSCSSIITPPPTTQPTTQPTTVIEPIVLTTGATIITQNGAKLNAYLSNLDTNPGSANYLFIYYGTNPAVLDKYCLNTSLINGVNSCDAQNILPGTKYYFKASLMRYKDGVRLTDIPATSYKDFTTLSQSTTTPPPTTQPITQPTTQPTANITAQITNATYDSASGKATLKGKISGGTAATAYFTFSTDDGNGARASSILSYPSKDIEFSTVVPGIYDSNKTLTANKTYTVYLYVNDANGKNLAVAGPATFKTDLGTVTKSETFKVLYPNGGENWKLGNKYVAKWTPIESEISEAKIYLEDYSKDPEKAESTRLFLDTEINPSLGSYEIPVYEGLMKNGDKYKIRIQVEDKTSHEIKFSDRSDNYFSITVSTTTIPTEKLDPPTVFLENIYDLLDQNSRNTRPAVKETTKSLEVYTKIYSKKFDGQMAYNTYVEVKDISSNAISSPKAISSGTVTMAQESTDNSNWIGKVYSKYPGTGDSALNFQAKEYCFYVKAQKFSSDGKIALSDIATSQKICVLDKPWIITQNFVYSDNGKTVNLSGRITNFAKYSTTGLNAYFKLYPKGYETKAVKRPYQKNPVKPNLSAGNLNGAFSEEIDPNAYSHSEIPEDAWDNFCFQACAEQIGGSSFIPELCGQEICFNKIGLKLDKSIKLENPTVTDNLSKNNNLFYSWTVNTNGMNIDAKYWFEYYKIDSQGNVTNPLKITPSPDTKKFGPNGSKTADLFLSFTNSQSDKQKIMSKDLAYCVTPFAQINGKSDFAKGEAFCYPRELNKQINVQTLTPEQVEKTSLATKAVLKGLISEQDLTGIDYSKLEGSFSVYYKNNVSPKEVGKFLVAPDKAFASSKLSFQPASDDYSYSANLYIYKKDGTTQRIVSKTKQQIIAGASEETTTTSEEIIIPWATTTPPVIKPFAIISPNGGEKINIGDILTVKWGKGNYANQNKVAIALVDYTLSTTKATYITTALLENSGEAKIVITKDMIANISSPRVSGDKYKIYVVIYDQSGMNKLADDLSDNYFSIQGLIEGGQEQGKGVFKIKNPVGNEVYKQGDTMDIAWDIKDMGDKLRLFFVLETTYEGVNGKLIKDLTTDALSGKASIVLSNDIISYFEEETGKHMSDLNFYLKGYLFDTTNSSGWTFKAQDKTGNFRILSDTMPIDGPIDTTPGETIENPPPEEESKVLVIKTPTEGQVAIIGLPITVEWSGPDAKVQLALYTESGSLIGRIHNDPKFLPGSGTYDYDLNQCFYDRSREESGNTGSTCVKPGKYKIIGMNDLKQKAESGIFEIKKIEEDNTEKPKEDITNFKIKTIAPSAESNRTIFTAEILELPTGVSEAKVLWKTYPKEKQALGPYITWSGTKSGKGKVSLVYDGVYFPKGTEFCVTAFGEINGKIEQAENEECFQ